MSDEEDEPGKDDEEAQRYDKLEERAVRPSGGAATSISATLPEPNHHDPGQLRASPRPRESLDGETIFAVGGEDGEEGDLSEGEEEADEGKKLTKS